MEKYNDEFVEVTLKDESGKDVVFDHLLTFAYESEKYIALMPVDNVEGIGDDEVLLLHVKTEDGEDAYESISNDILLNEVFDEFIRLLDELDEDDEE